MTPDPDQESPTMPDTPRSTGGTWEDYKDAFPAGKNITEGSPTMPDTLDREEHQHKRRSPCCRDEAVRWLRESLNGSLGLGGLFLDEYNKGYAAGKKDGDIDTAAHLDALTAAVRKLPAPSSPHNPTHWSVAPENCVSRAAVLAILNDRDGGLD